MTASAWTTCQSFSTVPSSIASAPATCSTSRRSSTLKVQETPVIADPAPHTLLDSDDSACRDLGCLSSTIRLLKPCRHGLDAETAERFRCEGAQPLDRCGRAVVWRWRGTSIEPMPDLHQLPGADQTAQRAANLVITAEVTE